MAYVSLTVRCGTEHERDQIQEALSSYFEDGWGEVMVELTNVGTHWRIDKAWAKPPGEATPRPGESWDCSDQVAHALALGERAFDPAKRREQAALGIW